MVGERLARCALVGAGIFSIATSAMKDERISLAARGGTSGSFIASPRVEAGR